MGTITKRSTINKSTVAVKAYDKVRLARNNHRPTGMDYISRIFDDFIELHGDRKFADDPAIVGGLALLDGKPVTVIACEAYGYARLRFIEYLEKEKEAGA